MFEFLRGIFAQATAVPSAPAINSIGQSVLAGPLFNQAPPAPAPSAPATPSVPEPPVAGEQPLWWPGTAARLSDADVRWAAAQIGCEAALVWAFCDQEGGGGGFNPDGRPRILFEPAKFSKHTHGRYDGKVALDGTPLSIPRWFQGLKYGKAGNAQWERLRQAAELGRGTGSYRDTREAALMSASYGMFQVLGENYAEAGYDNLDHFIQDMCHAEREHLAVFVKLAKSRKMDVAMRAKDWPSMSRTWNGSGNIPVYSASLRGHYQKRSAG